MTIMESRKQADERKKTYFMGILSDICDVIRGATAAIDYQDLFSRADKMRSFADSEVNPEVIVSSRETFKSVLGA